MYLNYFRLKEAPFNITPDPAFLYWSPSHKEALAAISYAVDAQKGYAVLIGEVGSGKTTILRAYLDNASRETVRTVYIINPELDFPCLVENIFRDLELPQPPGDVSMAVDMLHQYLLECYERNVRVVLVIDEAQRMPVDTLERLRILSNLETSKAKLLQIVLCGQPEFDDVLARHELRQFRERIGVRARLSLLNKRESREYIKHRVSCAGAEMHRLFGSRAIKCIIRYARGNPRLINLICDNALIDSYAAHEKEVSKRIARETAISLNLAPHPKFRWRDAFATAAICGTIAAVCIGGALLPYNKWLAGQMKRNVAQAVTVAAESAPVEKAQQPEPPKPEPRQAETPMPKPQAAPVVDGPILVLDPQYLVEALPRQPQPAPSPQPAVAPQPAPSPQPQAEKKPAPEEEVVTVTVKYGQSVWTILREVNGRPCEELIPRVVELNPEKTNINLLQPGDKIKVPKVGVPSPDESRENSYAKVL